MMTLEQIAEIEAGARDPEAFIEGVAKAIHDTDDMADTVWPDGEDDDGRRDGDGYVRLCRDPEMFRQAARAAFRSVGLDLATVRELCRLARLGLTMEQGNACD